MINIKNLTQAAVGEWVIYTDGVGQKEEGKLKSWNDTTIFVVFKCNGQWDAFANYTGNGCNPADLRFKSPQARKANCGEHHYLPYGRYQGGVKCQDCGDEIGTQW